MAATEQAQLVACARALFEGAPGSAGQRDANEWLMAFQRSDAAWAPALSVLQHPPVERGRVLAAPVLVAMQIVRLKTTEEWPRLPPLHRRLVRDTMLALLAAACTSTTGALSPAALRIACVVVADIVVKSGSEWAAWKSDLQQIADAGLAQKSAAGAIVFEEVVGAIPQQLARSLHSWGPDEQQAALARFRREYEHVMFFARTVLSSIPDAHSSALRCIESWLVGCVAPHGDFGLDAVKLHTGGLLDPLFSAAVCDDEKLSQLAAEIIADAFALTAPEDPLESESLVEAIWYAAHRLLETEPAFERHLQSSGAGSGSGDDADAAGTGVCRGLSRIACSLAITHTAVLLSPEMNERRGVTDSADAAAAAAAAAGAGGRSGSFIAAFLEYLLRCSAHRSIDVAEPTLEFWFFFLDKSTQSGSLWHRLTTVSEQEHVLSLLGRLVNALIDHCRFPVWFIDTDALTSDDVEVDAIATVRREIADTLLSLFSKWPGLHGARVGNYHSCVKGLVDLLFTTGDVARVDAILFLLEYMIELFDMDSSDSSSDVSDDDELVVSRSSEGIQLLQSVLRGAHALPTHPLVVNGIAKYLRSLSTALVLPGETYVQASLDLCRGLRFSASFAVASHALLSNAASISKYTDISERSVLLETLLSHHSESAAPPGVSTAARGDLIEATFHTMGGVSDAAFAGFCNTALTPLTTAMQSASSSECARAVTLLSRAIRGVCDPRQALALVDQVWPLVGAAIARHQRAEPACRASAVQLFLSVVPSLDAHHAHIEREMIELILRWYAETMSADMLRCCGAIIAKEKENATFASTVEHMIPVMRGSWALLFTVFRQKIRDQPPDDLEAGERGIAAFCLEQRNVDAVAGEVVQFMALVRQVLKFFPLTLIRPRAPEQRSLHWHALRLGAIFLEVDHQAQEISDAVCDFFVDACCAPQDACIRDLEQFASAIMRGVLSYFGAKRVHCRQRSLWEFLFQILHSPRVPVYIQAIFHSALGASLFESAELRSVLSIDALEEVQTELLARRQRPRFRQYLSQLARHLETLASSA
ncbi:hypothetical protein PybrP1_009881 [[Pythium] brassicae (nom. inval.)]|nr:hypothetical protein PybrP1_009881 [[Pythium] brassicae (nom. inval.)]